MRLRPLSARDLARRASAAASSGVKECDSVCRARPSRERWLALSVRDVERPGERWSGRLEPNEKLDASERRVEGMALLGRCECEYECECEGMALLGRLLESRPRLDGT